MPQFKEPCPACGYPIEGKTSGLFAKHLQLPNFCGSCSHPIYSHCPKCQFDFLHLTNYCPNCNHELYRRTKPQTPVSPVITDQQKQYLKQLRTDTEDLKLFNTESLRMIVLRNPANRQIFQFIDIISQITEDMNGPQKVTLVESALPQIDLFQAVQDLSDYDTQIANGVRKLFLFCAKDVTPYFKSHRDYLPTPARLEELANFASTHMIQALQSTRNELRIIQTRYSQLKEYFPRYKKIMTRTGFLDFVIGITAGLLEVEAVAEVWENWRNLSDNDFMNTFQKAFNQFYNSASQFIADTKKATDPVIHQIVADYIDITLTIIDGIERLAAAGIDIEPIYHKLHQPETSLDDGDRVFIEAVLTNLREQGFLSGQSERNLRYLLGLDKKK
ncbi:MAG TPA: zinc ribbon domain-containing protein [Bacillota bacterium]|nr:zinc ribbon domain-containing protein [Bacillota bacterium]